MISQNLCSKLLAPGFCGALNLALDPAPVSKCAEKGVRWGEARVAIKDRQARGQKTEKMSWPYASMKYHGNTLGLMPWPTEATR